MDEGPSILTYKDTTLYKSDFQLLLPGYWLNDRLIGFYFDYLEEKAMEAGKNVGFINPSVLMMIKTYPGPELKEILESLELGQKDLVFVPVNDNQNVKKAGGSHWSLLVFSKRDQKFYHFDSYGKANFQHAQQMALKMGHVLGVKGSLLSGSAGQQPNTCDCGVYLLAHTEYLISHAKEDLSKLDLSIHVPFEDVTKLRTTIENIILAMIK